MEFSPKQLFINFKNGKISKPQLIEILLSLVEKSSNQNHREASLKLLEKLNMDTDKIEKLFEFFENLLLSDDNPRIRILSVQFLTNNFLFQSLPLFKWTLEHEKDYQTWVSLTRALTKINTSLSRTGLIKELEKIGTLKYINKQKGIRNSKFRSDITFLLNSGIINNLNQKEIAEILVNFKTISILIEKYYSVGYELTNGLVTELDLSDIQYEVRGWKAEFKNNINRISEINGLHNLKNLKRLDLSNNRIKSLAGLENLKSINSLYLSNNQIGNPKELIHLKQLNLDYLDLYGNDISTQIEKTEFNRNLKIRINKFNF